MGMGFFNIWYELKLVDYEKGLLSESSFKRFLGSYHKYQMCWNWHANLSLFISVLLCDFGSSERRGDQESGGIPT